MRKVLSILGDVAVVVGLGGLAVIAIWEIGASSPAPARRLETTIEFPLSDWPLLETGDAIVEQQARIAPSGWPITRVDIPRIGLHADVVSSRVIGGFQGVTWEVPAFKAGQAEGTAGVGGTGNAVLFGHVRSRASGDVFRFLDRAEKGDLVEVKSGDHTFEYRVVETRSVAATDVSVVLPTDSPSLTLITCGGLWLPTIWDYAERVVVRAELVSDRWTLYVGDNP